MAAQLPKPKVLYTQARANKAYETGHILYIDGDKVSARLGSNAINMIKKAGPDAQVVYNARLNVAGKYPDVYQALLVSQFDAATIQRLFADPNDNIMYSNMASPQAQAIVERYAAIAAGKKALKPKKAKAPLPVYTLEDVVDMKKILGKLKAQAGAPAGVKAPGTPQGNKKQAYAVRLANAHAKGKGFKIAGFATKGTAGAAPVPGPRSRFRAIALNGLGGLQGTIVVDNLDDLRVFGQALAAETGQAQLAEGLLARFNQGLGLGLVQVPQVQQFAQVPPAQFNVPALPAQFNVPAVPGVPALPVTPQQFNIPGVPALPVAPVTISPLSPRTPGGRRPGATSPRGGAQPVVPIVPIGGAPRSPSPLSTGSPGGLEGLPGAF